MSYPKIPIRVIVFVALAYLFTAQLGDIFELAHYAVTLASLASGVALAAILIYGPKILPAIVLGALADELLKSTPLGVIPGMIISATGAALISWWGMASLHRFKKNIETPQNLMILMLWGAVIGPLFSAVNGVVWLYLGDIVSEQFTLSAIYWLMGKALGVMLLVPPLLLWADKKYTNTKHNQRYLAWMSVIVMACVLIFTNILFIEPLGHISPVLFFPLVVWGALYVGFSAVHAGVFLIFMSAFSSHLIGVGFFAENEYQVPTDLWAFIISLSITGLAVAASNVQREQAEWKAASSRMHEVLSDSSLSLQELLQLQCDDVVDDEPGCYSAVLLLNEGSTELNFIAHSGLPDELIFDLEKVNLDDEHSPIVRCLESGEMMSSLENKELWSVFEEDLSSWGGANVVPIRNLFRQPLGVLCIFYRSSTRFQLADLQRHQRAAYQCSLLTVRKRIEEALAEKRRETENERALLRSIIDANPDLIFVNDNQGAFTLCNGAFERFASVQKDEIIGNSNQYVFGPNNRTILAEMDNKILTERSTLVREEIWVSHSDKRKILLDLIKAPLKDNDGNTYGVIGLGRDVTQHRELEAEVVAMTDNQQRVIGQELHDGVGQKLVGVSFLTKLIEQQLNHTKSDLAPQATRLTENINEIIGDIRGLARGLFPIELESNGLSAALERLAKNITATSSIECRYKSNKTVLVEDQITALNLYRIAQEAANNAVRHGEATEIIISLLQQPDGIILSIIDNGNGFDLEQYRNGTIDGIGLQSMHYRSSLIKADLTFLNSIKGGFEVKVTLT
ncbi:MAG: MASE1 domain-containing protein [Cycloclasticus sp.]|nr:MASE1 domain-containing protein [Cycloclasticus sp.]